MENEVVLFRDGEVELEVQISPDQETVWLSSNQMSDLFDRDEKTIRKHVNKLFSDGNKRIAATMFLYFLDKNGILFDGNTKLIDDHTLVALTIMIAESKPDEKEMMVSVIMNCIG